MRIPPILLYRHYSPDQLSSPRGSYHQLWKVEEVELIIQFWETPNIAKVSSSFGYRAEKLVVSVI